MTEAKTKREHYRADIDGLRALAVLAVVLFHYELRWPSGLAGVGTGQLVTPGGYVGVDLFFVISGYLIGGILLREQERDGNISLLRFYERRIRRIVPAFAAMLLAVSAAAKWALLPTQLREYARSALAAVGSVSNLWLMWTTGYFEAHALIRPLLHTWSLSVEEQFYVALPLVLIALRRRTLRVKMGVLGTIAVLSLMCSVWLRYRSPEAGFYLPVSRAWELLAGVLLASGVLPRLKTEGRRNVCAIVGLVLIAWAMEVFTERTGFPGFAAMLPCAGAMLVIAAGESGGCTVSRWVGWKPFAAIGLVSYSLYLWHWPLFLVNRDEWFAGWTLSMPALLLVLAAVTFVSWRFVEQPFRVGHLYLPRRVLFAGTGALATVFAGWCVWTNGVGATPGQRNERMVQLDEFRARHSAFGAWQQSCFTGVNRDALAPECLSGTERDPHVLLFGDSQMAQLVRGLEKENPQVKFDVATGGSCKPLLENLSSADPVCREMVRSVFDGALPRRGERAVVLGGLWFASDLEALDATVQRLSGMGLRVYLMGPSTYYDQPLPLLLYRAEKSGDAGLPGRHLDRTATDYAAMETGMQAMERYPGVRYVSLRGQLCADAAHTQCAVYVPSDGGAAGQAEVQGEPLLFDRAHLTVEGGAWLAARLRRVGAMNDMAAPR